MGRHEDREPGADEDQVDPPIVGAMPPWARRLLARTRSITPVGGITEQDLVDAWEACGGRCAVSELPFRLTKVGTGKAQRPFAPSPDRIDRTKGYVASNVRLVCVITNFSMNAWGDDTFHRMVRSAAALLERTSKSEKGGWEAQCQARIRAAQQEAVSLAGEALKKQIRRITALKAVCTKGPEGLKRGAERAAASRRLVTGPAPRKPAPSASIPENSSNPVIR
jgi:hypothetical protein